jgi:uncharacterized protein YecT (DUF1311 family)
MTRSRAAAFAWVFALGAPCLMAPYSQSQTQSEMTQSADQSTRKVMADLDAAIHQYRKRLSAQSADDNDTDRLKEFDESQRKWVEFRKAACDFESSGVRGGSVEGMVNLMCWETYTRERLKHLQYLLNCVDGDLSCPVSRDGT